MFPPRCAQPPCRNIDVTSVDQKGSGMPGARSRPSEYSRGTIPQAVTKDCSAPSEPCESSRKNASTLTPMMAQLTSGGGPPCFASPMGIIGSLISACLCRHCEGDSRQEGGELGQLPSPLAHHLRRSG